jgi:membrane protease YdiL (CAAX protease family)
MATETTAERGGFRETVRRNQLIVFVALSYALSWWAWIWFHLDPGNVDAPILPIGPLLAALIVLFIIGGFPAIGALLRKIVHWRVGWIWYLVVIGLPIALTLAALAINQAMGAQQVAEFEVPDAGSIAFRFIFILLFIGLGEEPGWRGFALPRLLKTHVALTAALILGIIHMVWHLPLFGVEYDVSNVVPWAITVVCFSIVTCWIYLHTEGSVLMPMLMHASNNTIALVWKMFAGPDQTRLWWIWCVLWVLTTMTVVAATGRTLTRSSR